MKTIFNIFQILLFISLHSVNSQTKPVDTVYISKDSIKGYSQSIFFENNKKSEFYEHITSFKFGLFDKQSYDYSLEFLRQNKIELKKEEPILPSKKWITLKQYKGQFYAYYPCDFYSYYQVSLNDSTYIDWTGEGPIANKIIYQKKLGKRKFELKTKGPLYPNRTITIHIINISKGIAIFEQKTDNNTSDYLLMIMAEKIKTVPLIVNNCENNKQSELIFEEPDFQRLLNIDD